MSSGDWFNGLALIVGWTVLLSGGAMLFAYIVGAACTYAWRKIRDAYALGELMTAYRAYQRAQSGPMREAQK